MVRVYLILVATGCCLFCTWFFAIPHRTIYLPTIAYFSQKANNIMTLYYGGSLKSNTALMNRRPSTRLIDPAVEDMLINYQERFCTFANASIFVTTFNVNGKTPPPYLQDWLTFDTENLPDFVVIGLQEMDLALGTYVVDNTVREYKWLCSLRKSLPTYYQLVEKIRLVGIFMVIYRHAGSSIPQPYPVYSSWVATGFFKFGNKGGVGISLNINDTPVCFINSHLAAGDMLSRRNEDFRQISKMRFDNDLGVYDHDVVIWLGDLNYRLDSPNSFHEMVKIIEAGNSHDLIQYDQLRKQQESGHAFSEFKELLGLPFKPTYKYDVGTSIFDTSEKRRLPAWCDRILYWRRNEQIKVGQNEYSSVERVVLSDHKPVRSVYKLLTKVVDHQKKSKVYKEVLRKADQKANNII